MKYRNRKLKALITKILIIIVALIVSFFVIKKIKYSDFMQTLGDNTQIETPAASKEPSEKYSAELDAFLFQQDEAGTKEIGILNTIVDDQPNTYSTINYPVIGHDSIDAILKNDVTTLLDSFKNSFKDYTAPNAEARAYLSIDYESYLTGDSIASFVYRIQYDSPGYANPVQEIATHVFLLSTGEEISPDKLLAGDYLNLFAYRTSCYVDANPDYNANTPKSEFEANYTADASNFTKYTVSMRGLTLYFDPFTIAPGEFGCLSYTIPAAEILPYMIFDPFKQVTPDITEEAVSDMQSDTLDPDKPMIALTFDDGPSTEVTPQILDVLEKYNAHATFFLVGNRIKGREDIIKRAYDLGCDIGNHSYDHARLTTLKKKQIIREFKTTSNLIKKITGKKSKFVRTPYGAQTPSVLKATKYPVILWDIDTMDWSSLNEKKVAKHIIGKVQDGDIVLMHDLYPSTAKAVQKVVPKLIKEGYQLVSISELFKAKGIKPKKSKVYYSIR